jgi:transcription elongation factor Elf1
LIVLSVFKNYFKFLKGNSSGTVDCKMDRKSSAGKVLCRICGKAYQTTITFLTDPIDVYSEWIDECQKENEGGEKPDDYEDDEEEEQIVQHYAKKSKPTKKPQKPQSDEEEEEEEEDNSDNDPDLFLKKHSK